MSDDYDGDDDFEGGDADSSVSTPMNVNDVRKGTIVVMKGRPAKVVETSTSKTGKHGHAKMNIVALDIFNGKKYEGLYPTSHGIPQAIVERSDYTLINIADDGFLSLMLENGSTREDLKLPDGEVGEQIKSAFDAGKDVSVSTIKAMNIEQVMSLKEL